MRAHSRMNSARSWLANNVAWIYFNGDLHKWLGQPMKPMTHAYCGDCAPVHIPGWNARARLGSEHWTTGFRTAPGRLGRLCDGCGKDI